MQDRRLLKLVALAASTVVRTVPGA